MSKRTPNIAAIDYKISNLHSELMDLYRRRSSIARSDSKLSMDMIANPWEAMETARMYQAKWLDEQYDKLKDSWLIYDIKIPSLNNLRIPLARAHKIIKQFSQEKPELRNNLEIILVPPTKMLGFPLKDKHREKQIRVAGSDVIETDFNSPVANKDWKLMVIYGGPSGVYLGPPSKLISDELYMIAGYDTRGLGANEYNALTLQRNRKIDTDTWTLLLKPEKQSKVKPKVVPMVTFTGNRYRFDVDDINSLFGDLRYRPAIVIEGDK